MAALVLGGCAGLRPPATELVTVQTTRSTKYYPVRGSTSLEIFDAIKANGLADTSGRPAIGLTSGHWAMDVRTVQDHALTSCNTASIRIGLNLVVTLPELAPAAPVSQELGARWDRLAARVAAHEERHVDIYLDGARQMKTRMETALEKPSSCAALQAAIQGIWTSQQAATEAAQERFHLDDEASIQRERAPLQAQIEAHKRHLAALESEAAAAAAAQADLARQVTASATQLTTLQAHIDASAGARAGCAKADATPALRALCRDHETLVTRHDTLVTEHNQVVQRRGTLAAEHRRVLERTNELIDALNWTQ